jgi:DEAD/DEAH box helicase domain-containing protein
MIKNIINYLKISKLGESIVYENEIKRFSGSYVSLNSLESPIAKDILLNNGINNLYTHQFEAYNCIKRGENVVITTPTASGKTLCYNLPILEDIFKNNSVHALYLFPIKALGYDQKRQLEEFLKNTILEKKISVEIIDGDTDKKKRRTILLNPPNIIISNVDILNYTILPNIAEWSKFLTSLKYIVMDELHSYRGIFGSHVFNLLKRFSRLYKNIQFITSSATIGNASEFAENLIDRKFVHIKESGAPRGNKNFILINPDMSPSKTAAYLLKINIDQGIKTICFTKSRRETETIYASLLRQDITLKNFVSSYRAGFLPEERREIENKFLNNEIKAVIATSAFELGIDIGGIDSTILVGYPGSLINLWQRAGRSGRKLNDSLIILIAGQDALDQYYVKHPELLLGNKFEEITVDRENKEMNKKHIHCACFEEPIKINEEYYINFKNEIMELVENNELFYNAEGNKVFTLKKYPYKEIDLRQTGDTYSILCNNILIGTNSARRIYSEMHEGAIYIHRGSQFIVKKIDKAKKCVYVNPINPDYYTLPLLSKETLILKVFKEKTYLNMKFMSLELKVTESLKGFRKISIKTGEKLQDIELSKEPISFITKGICILINEAILEYIKSIKLNPMGSIHAAEHALISLIPTFLLCDRSDIGGISYPLHPQLSSPAIFIYDGYSGGIGLTNRVYDIIEDLITKTTEHIKECTCIDGCPSCIYSPKCGSGNYPLDKKGCIELFDKLLSKSENYNINNKSTKRIRKNSNGIIVFDVETKYSSDEVGGFKNAYSMGISVAVAYDFSKDDYSVFLENEIGSFIKMLENAKIIIGFNIINFDLKVLSGYQKLNLEYISKLDIFSDIKTITGRRFSLEKLANATLATKKMGNGLLALKWYNEGKIDLIIEYCKKDVEITKDLLLFGIKNKYIYAPLKESIIKIPVNWSYVMDLILNN